ncbi:hypothetical protein [Arthrobacter sp. PAMC25564]|uniref:hypothetical protein n=1 Tax=Arthrobacter sp. PAMC25564 TaxID=2565366 RepID=UPI0014482774|nr:hypothetical protein [Arthrobacter sp. PAMC25564]
MEQNTRYAARPLTLGRNGRTPKTLRYDAAQRIASLLTAGATANNELSLNGAKS